MGQNAVDVLIVGAGASGAAVAYSLADMGLKILCLEQGDWVDRSKLPSTRKDYELHRYDKFSCDPNVRKLPQDYPINSENSAITPVNYNAVGGSTINYLGHWPRFHPSDFRVKTLDGVDDWPIDYDTLAPYYDLNSKIMGVSGFRGIPLIRLTMFHYPQFLWANWAKPRKRIQSAWLALVAFRYLNPES